MGNKAQAKMDITLSSSAAGKIRALQDADPAMLVLRLSVEGGGCSGFQYDIQIANEAHDGDLLIERDGARLFVDPVSAEFVRNAELDWTQELIGASFKVRNPNAKTSCGCGVSFSV